jgi:hypothetical protein
MLNQIPAPSTCQIGGWVGLRARHYGVQNDLASARNQTPAMQPIAYCCNKLPHDLLSRYQKDRVAEACDDNALNMLGKKIHR